MMQSARARLRDSHDWEMGLLGKTVNDSDGGGISVQGDTTIHNTGLKPWVAVALTLASLLAGGGLTGMYAMWNKPTIAASQPTSADVQNWRLGLKVTSTP